MYFHVQTPHHISKAFFAHTKVIVYDIHFNLCIILSSKDDILHEKTWLLSRVSGVLGVNFWITATQHTTDHKISKLSANCHHITRYHLLRFYMIYSHSPINARPNILSRVISKIALTLLDPKKLQWPLRWGVSCIDRWMRVKTCCVIATGAKFHEKNALLKTAKKPACHDNVIY